VSTSELRAVSDELKQQWLSQSQSHSAHDLLASFGSSEGAEVATIHGHDDAEPNHAVESKKADSVGTPPKFKRRGGSLRDKLRGTVSEARTESRYFS